MSNNTNTTSTGGESQDKDINIGIKSNEERLGYKHIREGLASMYYKVHDDKGEEIFYNPVQVQNRDLSILMISLFAERRAEQEAATKLKKWQSRQKRIEAESGDSVGEKETKTMDDFMKEFKGLRILDALAASGLRSIRYVKECYAANESLKDVKLIREVVVNDLDEAAVEQAHENVRFNQMDPNIVRPQHGDALDTMYAVRGKNNEEKFDVIDLDPYGSAAPFLDAAVQAVSSGGLLCVTCTDMVVLGGSHPETCFGRYRAMPMPNARYLHELALRILLQTIEAKANTYGRTIKPIISVGMAFYIRVFVEIHDNKAGVISSSLRVGHVYQSIQCPSFFTVAQGSLRKNTYIPSRGPPVSVCEETGSCFKIAGPVWLGELHDFDVVDEAVRRLEKGPKQSPYPVPTMTPLHGLLCAVSEELSDIPLYYKLPDLCKVLHCSSPPMEKFQAAIVNAGYRVSGQHKEPQAVKTDAPNRVIWDIMRSWIRDNPISVKHMKEGSVIEKILTVEPEKKIDFTIPDGFAKRKKAQRFPMNPAKNWGPKARAVGKRKQSSEAEGSGPVKVKP